MNYDEKLARATKETLIFCRFNFNRILKNSLYTKYPTKIDRSLPKIPHGTLIAVYPKFLMERSNWKCRSSLFAWTKQIFQLVDMAYDPSHCSPILCRSHGCQSLLSYSMQKSRLSDTTLPLYAGVMAVSHPLLSHSMQEL